MRTLCLTVYCLLLLCVNPIASHCQGCSDAGFCSISSLKPSMVSDSGASVLSNRLAAQTYYGVADHSIAVVGFNLEYNRQLIDELAVDAKMSFLAQHGNDITTFAPSDLFLNAVYHATSELAATAGFKVPLNNGNRMHDERPLPMDYQSSLGTFDVILGVGYNIGDLQINAALQQPLSQNSNQFLAEVYPAGSVFSSFQSTNSFQRSGDVLVRISYNFNLAKEVNIALSLLPIYHLRNDKYIDIHGVEQVIAGSQGLTLNTNLFLRYDVTSSSTAELSIAAPVVVREARPDGLTRSLLVSLEYAYRW